MGTPKGALKAIAEVSEARATTPAAAFALYFRTRGMGLRALLWTAPPPARSATDVRPTSDVGQHLMSRWRSRFQPLLKHPVEPLRCYLRSKGGHAATRVHCLDWRCGGMAVAGFCSTI